MANRDYIYARQSRDKKDSVSIEAQIEECKKFADKNAEILFDKGFSGKNTDRPNMQNLIENVKAGNVKRVVVYKLDRISRNILDFANLIELFKKYNVSFISTQEQFDTSSPMGNAMLFLVITFAQMERETIAQRIKDNYDFRAKTGQYFMGGNVPFGYRAEKKKVNGKKASVIVPNENKELLLKMYDMLFETGNVSGIAKYLNSVGIQTSSGNPYSNVTVKRILLNMTPVQADKHMYDFLVMKGYTIETPEEEFDGSHGLFINGKKKNGTELTDNSDRICVIGSHEPLIPSETFLKAYSLLETDSPYKPTKRSQKTFLAGLMKCGECGYSIGLKCNKKNNKEYAYYFCRGKSSLGICQSKIWIPKDGLEELVLDETERYLESIKVIKSNPNEQDNTDSKIAELKEQIDNLVMNLGKGNAVVDEVITEKITQMQEEMNQLQDERSRKIENSNMTLAEEFRKIRDLPIQEKTNVIRKIIGRIEIDKDENVKIHYLF